MKMRMRYGPDQSVLSVLNLGEQWRQRSTDKSVVFAVRLADGSLRFGIPFDAPEGEPELEEVELRYT